MSHTENKIIYLSGLNGLRAIAALSVLIAHVMMPGLGEFGVINKFRLPLAEFGVTLFFVISGFLITYLLLLERNQTKISVKNFYMRRILRIWPLYYFYIFICAVIWIITDTNKFNISKTIYWYLFFSANIPFIFSQGILLLVHYWSIGVEEQFYIFWPWLVKFSKNELLKLSFFLFVIIFSVKVISWIFLGKDSTLYQSLSVTRFHCMMIGAIGSILYYNNEFNFMRLMINKILQLIIWSFFILIGFGLINIPAPIAHEIFAIISLALIIGQITLKNRIINLENTFLNFIGRVSYGIYVIHPLVIFIISPLVKSLEINTLSKYTLSYSSVLFTTIILAYCSYEYLEKPFVKYKTKFAIIQSSNGDLHSSINTYNIHSDIIRKKIT